MKTMFLLASTAALMMSTSAIAQTEQPAGNTPPSTEMPAAAPAPTADAAAPAAESAPAMPAPTTATDAMATPAAPAATATGEAKTYPTCSAKLKDNCINRGAKRR